MNPILKRLCDKNARLALAYQTHQDAYLAHTVSGQRWQADPSEANNHQFVNTEMAWDNARDTVITLERGLLDATQGFLSGQPADAYKAVRRAALNLQRGFDLETETFKTFNSASGDTTALREKYEAARSAVISRGWSLMDALDTLHCGREVTGTGFHAALYFDQAEGLTAKGKPLTPPPPDTLAVKPDLEGEIETDLDGSSPWHLAETDAEREKILYQNRKATLGPKAAGRMLAQDRYWAKRQREEDAAKLADTDDLRDEARGTFY